MILNRLQPVFKQDDVNEITKMDRLESVQINKLIINAKEVEKTI